jgi:hypothetical protein
MSQLLRQASFTGGAIQALLTGRTDWSKYGISVRTMRNFFANPVGPAMNRAGTRWLATVGAVLGQNWQLVPFAISNDIAYSITVCDRTMKLYDTEGALVAVVAGSPYLNADIPKLKWHQLGNTMFFACQGYAPAQLSQVAGVWTYSLITYTGDGFVSTQGMSWWAAWPADNAPIGVPVAGGAMVRAWAAGQNYNQGDYMTLYTLSGFNIETTVWMALTNLFVVPADPNTVPKQVVQAVDASHPAKKLAWVCCIEWEDVFGNTRESTPIWTTLQAGEAIPIGCYTDRPAKIEPGVLGPARPANFARILGYKFYKGLPGAYGFVGRSDTGSFTDPGLVPDFTQNPPENTDPTVFYDAAGAPVHSYPTVVSFFEQRFVEAGFPLQPHGISLSEIGNLFRFDIPKLTREDAAFDTGLLSETLNDIRSIIPAPGRALIFFTSTSEWSVKGAQGYPTGPTSIDPKRASGYGSSWLSPLLVGDMILYNTVLGQGVRDLEYNFQKDNMVGQDLSIFARDFFDTYSFISWAYADKPYNLVWMVRSDGNLIGLTYNKDQEVVAWHQHDSPGGFFKATCALPRQTEHSVFFLVERFGSVQLERMSTRLVTDVRYCNFLDCSIQLDNHNPGSSLQVNNAGVDIAGGDDITLTALGGAHPFVVGQEGNKVVFFPDSKTPYEFTIIQVVDTANVLCTAEQPIVAPWTLGLGNTGDWAFAKSVYAVNARYNGATLSVLADANYIGEFLVQGGVLTLDQPAIVVQAGILYTSDLELLPTSHPTEETSPMQKVIKKVWVELHKSRSLKAGPDLDHLKTWPQRKPKDPKVVPVYSGKISVASATGWTPDGMMSFRQDAPLPVTLVAVTREVEFGGT